MTITRKYFDKLIEILDSFCNVQSQEFSKFMGLKSSLFSLYSEITIYNLLEFNLSDDIKEILGSEDCTDFEIEREKIVISLLGELEASVLGRIWYGGELLYHLNRMRVSLLHLPITIQEKINELVRINQKGIEVRIKSHLNDKSPEEQIRLLNNSIKKESSKIGKDWKLIKKEDYANLLNQLKNCFEIYRSYISSNYPSISNDFSYFNKLVRAYLCDEREDVIVCRIHSYIPTNKDYSVTLNERIYDFCPRPPYNFEKIDFELYKWSWFGINKKDLLVNSELFNLSSIHRELVHIFLRSAMPHELLRLVHFLLRSQGKFVDEIETGNNHSETLVIQDESNHILLRLFSINDRSQNSVEAFISDLLSFGIYENRRVLFSSKPDDQIIEKFKDNNIDVAYINDLTRIYFENKNSELLHLYIMSRLDEKIEMRSEPTENARYLIQELKTCPLGQVGWATFENISSNIFKFLFEDSFSTYISETQASNDLDSLRRDLIVHNNFTQNTSFWGRVNGDYSAKILIIEFKNYQEEIDYDTMFSTTKYLNRNTGNVIIIFSRKGPRKKLLEQQKDLLREGKLIICFEEKEIIEMIEEKLNGVNPDYRLDLKLFKLLKRN